MVVPEGEYLTLEELGEVLRQLAYPSREEKTKGIYFLFSIVQ